MQNYQNQRLSKRLQSYGFTVDIDNGEMLVDGCIENISRDGMKVTFLPNHFFIEDRKYITVTSGYNKNFKLEIRPCWIKKIVPGNYHEIGFKILNPSESWDAFIQTMVPEFEPEESLAA